MYLDPILRKIDKNSKDKIEAWIRDQYLHPLETSHTFDEVLNWFKLNNIEFINSIPQCSPFEDPSKSFFDKTKQGTFIERILQQFMMILSRYGSEGGLFIFVGRKK